jgi:hypothetical protein
MNKDIVLPWTCETQDKVLRVLKWIALFGMPLMLVHLNIYWDHVVNQPPTALPLIEYVFGLFGSSICWGIQFNAWYCDDKLPSFRCKSEVEKPDNNPQMRSTS